MFRPKRVLAAVDFSESSRVALTLAARLVRHYPSHRSDAVAKPDRAEPSCELHVLHAEDPLLSAGAASAGIDLVRETREELSAFMRTAAPADRWVPLHHVVDGPSVETICAVALREQADLIVMGAHGMSGAGRLLFGSTTEGVLRRAGVSVLIVPDTWTPPHPDADDLRGTGPIVAGCDFSAASLAALAAAGDLAAALQTSLEVVHVVPSLSVLARWRSYADTAVQQQIDLARRDLARATDQLPSAVGILNRVESGAVHERLSEAATQVDDRHPLLVLGRRSHAERGEGPGTTAYRTLGLAQVPVLLHVPTRPATEKA